VYETLNVPCTARTASIVAVLSTLWLRPSALSRPSNLRYQDGTINPFEVGLGRDAVGRIKDKSMGDAIFNGEDVFMMGIVW
jgi:hypothetical protein